MTADIFVIERELANSEVFRSLSRNALLVLMDFYQKRKIKKVGRSKKVVVMNNGEITYYYSEAEKKGIPRSSFARALTELVEKGFIDIAHLGQGHKKDKSFYSMSERWRDWGTPQFKRKSRAPDRRLRDRFKAFNENRKKQK